MDVPVLDVLGKGAEELVQVLEVAHVQGVEPLADAAKFRVVTLIRHGLDL